MLKRRPFHEFHVAANARLVDFAGWEMPIIYRSINDEHEQTRKSGSLFDVSHMGRLRFSGPDAAKFLDLILTRNIQTQKFGQCRYSLVCNEAGGVIEKIADVLPVDVRSLKRYHFISEELMMTPFTVYRSGYTGEDGVEVVIPARAATMAVKLLTGSLDKPNADIKPAGLGARDTLRLEAGMPLYGHELGEQGDPISAGLGWAVDLTKTFIGSDALKAVAEAGPKRKLVGLELEGRRIGRQGAPVVDEAGKPIGEVTSGTFSPTLQKSIAMAYVDTDKSAVGTALAVDLKGTANAAKVVPLPFYKRS